MDKGLGLMFVCNRSFQNKSRLHISTEAKYSFSFDLFPRSLCCPNPLWKSSLTNHRSCQKACSHGNTQSDPSKTQTARLKGVRGQIGVTTKSQGVRETRDRQETKNLTLQNLNLKHESQDPAPSHSSKPLSFNSRPRKAE